MQIVFKVGTQQQAGQTFTVNNVPFFFSGDAELDGVEGTAVPLSSSRNGGHAVIPFTPEQVAQEVATAINDSTAGVTATASGDLVFLSNPVVVNV